MACKCGRCGPISIGAYCPDCYPKSKGGTVDDEYSAHVRLHRAHAYRWVDDPRHCPECGKQMWEARCPICAQPVVADFDVHRGRRYHNKCLKALIEEQAGKAK